MPSMLQQVNSLRISVTVIRCRAWLACFGFKNKPSKGVALQIFLIRTRLRQP